MSGQRPDEAMPETILLPETAASPSTVYDGDNAALHMAVVERNGVNALSAEWDRVGV